MTNTRSGRPRLSRSGTARRWAGLRADDDSRADDAPAAGVGAAPSPAGASDDLLARLAASEGAAELGDDLLVIADELLAARRIRPGEDGEALALALVSVLVASRQGSTRLPLDPAPAGPLGQILGPIARAAECARPLPELTNAAAAAAEDEARAPAGLIGAGDRPLILSAGGLALQRHHARELDLAAAVGPRMRAAGGRSHPQVDAALADVRARPGRGGAAASELSEEQASAIAAAARDPLTVIAGGPGTGKTAIVVALLRALARLSPAPEVALCAPTGKAAKRMDESIRAGLAAIRDAAPADGRLAEMTPAARTIHRLLGYQPARGRFRHHDHHPVAADVIVCDEASMVDLELADALLRALRPDARLVLLGDADQLPSVDAGAVFRDLAGAAEVSGAGHRLTRSYRMDPADPAGRAILVGARAVSRGAAGELAGPGAEIRATPRARPEDLAFEGLELLDTGGKAPALRAFLVDWHRRFLRPPEASEDASTRVYRQEGGLISAEDAGELEALFSAHGRRRLLAASRQLPAGAEPVNAFLHARARADLRAPPSAPFLPGEPVVMRRNDYRRRLFNGDQGLVLRVEDASAKPGERASLCAVFPGPSGYAAFPIDALGGHIEHAYALTIHRSQGSEYDAAAVLLPTADTPLLSRELLYTALTRARRGAAIVGPSWLLERASRSLPRHTGLASALEGAAREPADAPA